MTDASWERIVSDDATVEERIGAVTVGEIRAREHAALRQGISETVDSMLDEAGVTCPDQRAAFHAKAAARVDELGAPALIDARCDQLALALAGQQGAH